MIAPGATNYTIDVIAESLIRTGIRSPAPIIGPPPVLCWFTITTKPAAELIVKYNYPGNGVLKNMSISMLVMIAFEDGWRVAVGIIGNDYPACAV